MWAAKREEYRVEGMEFRAPTCIRAVPGPQDDYFDEAEVARFFSGEYTVESGSDRVGLRLQGETIRHARGFNIASDATVPGSIQIPGNGRPIVLLADRQTVGGYPKIATVISADLPKLGRLSIGSKTVFERVTVETAQALRRTMLSDLERLPEVIAPIRPSGRDAALELRDQNLISGVVNAILDDGAVFDE
jgi:allophanate hydrolase